MNNKIIFSFVLCIFYSLATAMEKKGKQPIIAQVLVNKNKENYTVKNIRKCDTWDLRNRTRIFYEYPNTVQNSKVVEAKSMQFISQNAIQCLAILGKESKSEYMLMFEGASYTSLKEELKIFAEIPKLKDVDIRTFHISLTNENEIKGITLQLTEGQVENIVNKKFYLSKIIAFVGIAGLVALIYYFDLYTKGRALLGRG